MDIYVDSYQKNYGWAWHHNQLTGVVCYVTREVATKSLQVVMNVVKEAT
jgi:hypothetical protein